MLIQQFRIMNALHIFIHVHMAMVYCISKAHSMASSFGGGLHNMGNTCFANSVLQGMFYTSRIQKVLCDERVPHGKENINNAHSIVHVKFVTEHSQGSEQLCMVCTLKSLYDECQTRSQVHPSGIYSQLKSKEGNNDIVR